MGVHIDSQNHFNTRVCLKLLNKALDNQSTDLHETLANRLGFNSIKKILVPRFSEINTLGEG